MRVFAGGVFVASSGFGFESPGVIAGVEAGEESRVGQFDKAAVEGGFIVALGNEGIGHVGVTDGVAGSGNVLQDSDAGCRGAQASPPNALAGIFDGDSDRFPVHSLIIAGDRRELVTIWQSWPACWA